MNMNDISGKLCAGETRVTHEGVTGLRYWRAGAPDAPVLLFLPGGGHLGRIAYGTEEIDQTQFLDYWLAKEGWGLLALSYPTDHPAVGAPLPEITLAEWTRWVARTTAEALGENSARKVFGTLWSMAGRSCNALNTAFQESGQTLQGVISLAAMPPLDGLMHVTPGGEPLTPGNLWAIGPADRGPHNIWVNSFLTDLAEQSRHSGVTIVPEHIYLRDFLCNTPVMLRGTPQRIRNGHPEWDPAAAISDMRADMLNSYPLAAAITPTAPEDGRHVLMDAASWNFVCTQAIRAKWQAAGQPTARWKELVKLSAQGRTRLQREVEGSHFFFTGASGAAATTRAIITLANELLQLSNEIDRILLD
ncbi:hypothetical protein G6M85_21420 [Agrobacterium tumefaciens]|uniref:hypothetical protein n=1 Tax=Agrobacterium tumefaciens TaxID=358 RepID=UPI0015747631|nr:hypothetical protein [Agrobacterium tumefaciens]NTE68165.1 hypothetical protein [Agrobacterium tumefaciens]